MKTTGDGLSCQNTSRSDRLGNSVLPGFMLHYEKPSDFQRSLRGVQLQPLDTFHKAARCSLRSYEGAI